MQVIQIYDFVNVTTCPVAGTTSPNTKQVVKVAPFVKKLVIKKGVLLNTFCSQFKVEIIDLSINPKIGIIYLK